VTTKAVNIQDSFLNTIRKESIPVVVYLVNGFQIRGVVKAFDSFNVHAQPPRAVRDSPAGDLTVFAWPPCRPIPGFAGRSGGPLYIRHASVAQPVEQPPCKR
jgi:RNA chaperone Hfq